MTMYKVLKVGEKEYKLKLTTSATIQVEEKLGENILDPIMRMSSNADIKGLDKNKMDLKKISKVQLPKLNYSVTILWGSLQKYHHGMTFEKTCELVDEYIDSGKTQMDLFEFAMDLLVDSGVLGKEENLK